MTNNEYANQCIACTVTSCKNHNSERNYCSLEKITVGANNTETTSLERTNCNDFVVKPEYE